MPAVPETKATWTNGVDALSSTNLHAYLRDPLRFLMNPPRAKLRASAAQSIPNNLQTAVLFGAETIDTDPDGVGGHSTVSNTSRYTARYPGWYQVSGGTTFATNTTGIRLVRWMVNGGNLPATDVLIGPVTGNTTRVAARTEQVLLNEGDYVELAVLQTSGGNLNLSSSTEEASSMNVLWIGLA